MRRTHQLRFVPTIPILKFQYNLHHLTLLDIYRIDRYTEKKYNTYKYEAYNHNSSYYHQSGKAKEVKYKESYFGHLRDNGRVRKPIIDLSTKIKIFQELNKIARNTHRNAKHCKNSTSSCWGIFIRQHKIHPITSSLEHVDPLITSDRIEYFTTNITKETIAKVVAKYAEQIPRSHETKSSSKNRRCTLSLIESMRTQGGIKPTITISSCEQLQRSGDSLDNCNANLLTTPTTSDFPNTKIQCSAVTEERPISAIVTYSSYFP